VKNLNTGIKQLDISNIMTNSAKDVYALFNNANETIFVSTDSNDPVSHDSDSNDDETTTVSSNCSGSSSAPHQNSEPESARGRFELGDPLGAQTAGDVSNDSLDVITTEAIDLSTLAPEPVVPLQKFCCLTYAPHLETRTVYVIVSGCFDTFSEAEEFSRVLHQRDPRWNRSVGETGRPLPIPLDRRLFAENPILRGMDLPVVPFNIISETEAIEPEIAESNQRNDETQTGQDVEEWEETEDNQGTDGIETESTIENPERSEGSVCSTSNCCITCLSKSRCALFLPCRHLTFCVDCARIQTAISNLCPICRSPIKEVLNVFL
jgi:hypothetical protein